MSSQTLTEEFEASRPHLAAVAYRLLGSREAADDAVQESWVRLNQSADESIQNLKGWLTTVVARICLDTLRARKAHREDALGDEHVATLAARGTDDESLLADSMGPALLVVLETLAPAERVAFVLHDMFDISFETISTVLGRSDVSTRQLASRARRKVRGPKAGERTRAEEQTIVEAFLRASRLGDFTALLDVLDPGIVLRADDVAIKVSAMNKDKGAPQFAREIRDPAVIAELFKGKAVGAQQALIDGCPGSTWIHDGKPRVAFVFTVEKGKIIDIGVIMNAFDLENMDIKIIEA